MKRLLIIFVLLFYLSRPLYGDNCTIPGWRTIDNSVKYVALWQQSGSLTNSYTLVQYDYNTVTGHWDEIHPNCDGCNDCTYWRLAVNVGGPQCYPWDGNLDVLFNQYSYCIDSSWDLDSVYAAKDYIDGNNGIEDYLNNNYPDGGSDPDFRDYFLDYVYGGDANLLSEEPPGESEVGNSGRAEPVFLSNGEYRLVVTDLSIAGRGLPVEIVRTYASRRDYNSRFGCGWDMNYNMKVRGLLPVPGEPNTVILLDGGGYRREYTQDACEPNLYTRQTDWSNYLDFNSADSTFKLIKKSGVKYNFDSNGNLSSIVDKNGNTITFTYDPNGLLPVNGYSGFFHTEDFGGPADKYGLIAREYKLTTITDTLGRQIDLYYDSNGLLIDVNDFAGRNWHYAYDSNNNGLLSVKNPNGLTTSYAYDPKYKYDFRRYNLVSITDPNGQTYLENKYDVNDMVEEQTYGDGNYVFVYDSDSNEATLTDRENHVTVMVYSNSGQVLSETIYTDDPCREPNSFMTQYFYDSNTLELVRTIYPKGNCIAYTYDGLANVTGIYRKIGPNEPNNPGDANVIATTYTYDSNHIYDINSVTDPEDNTTEFEYDAAGNVIKITYPNVPVYGQSGQHPIVEYTYYDHGEVNTVKAPDGIVTKYEYYDDSNSNDPNCGKLRKVTVDYAAGGLNITTEYKYDAYGNVREVNDPNGDITQFAYNELNLLTQTISPFNYVTNYSYTKNKKLEQMERVRTSDPNQITSYAYDILDHLKKVTDPCSYVTTYGYNKNEDPNLVTDANDNNTVSVYDERGLLVQVTDANGNTTKYTYTANGDINDVNDAKGNVTKYEYDDFDRLEKITYPDDSNETFSYDKNSNILSKKNRKGEIIEYDYDALNRLKVKSRQGDPNIYFSYDIAGRVVEVNDLRDVNDGGGITTYIYDRIGRVNDVNDIGSRVLSYGYDDRGLRTKLTYPDDGYITYEYDSMSRLRKIKDEDGNSIAEFDYDELSRRTLLTLGNDANAVYDYDIANRLLKLTNNINDVNITFRYDDYDKVGNRLSCKIGDANTHVYQYDDLYQLKFVDYNDGNSTSYSYDALGNRIDVNDGTSTTYDSNCLNQYTSVGGVSYLYDKNGNLIDVNNGQHVYSYGCENRLIDVNEDGNSVASYSYDYQGRRVEKIVYGTPDEKTRYCYDGDQVIAEYDYNDTSGSYELARKFIYGPGIDEPICMIDVANGDTVYYYHFDGVGSVIALSDVNRVIVECYSYDVFGEPNRTSDVNNPYFFTARRYDEETDLYYYRARYYDYYIGRFLQTDPVGYDDGLNIYEYVGNNPLTWVDASGLCKEDSLWKKWERFVQSSDILTTVGAFTMGGLERVYDVEQALRHPLKSLGGATVNTMESMYDFEKAAYNVLYDLGYSGTSSQLYRTFQDIGSGQSTIGHDIMNIASQSDFLSSDPYTVGRAWGSLTVDLEIVAILSHARMKIHKIHPAKHKFPIIGKRRHLQATIYLKSIDNSHINPRLPLRN